VRHTGKQNQQFKTGKPKTDQSRQQINIIMKKIIFLFFFFASISNVYSQFEEIQSFQKNLIENEVTASNVALVFKDGKAIYHHIENATNPKGKPIDNNTIFPIWSMSKPITIVAMMILHERGLIDFEDKVSKYIPEFENLTCKSKDSVYKCKKDLTLFHLMTHRSGYGYYGNPKFFTSTVKYNNLKDFASDVANHPVEFEPGSDYLYGINMAILGRVVEVVSKKSFYKFLMDEIFDPLNMDETKFYLTKMDRDRFQPLYINNGSIKGFSNDLDELTYDINNKAYFGGEGLVSTLKDYSNFCQMLVNGGVFKEHTIITQESIDMMTKPYTTAEGDPFDYGFSLSVLRDPVLDGTNSSKGIFGWSGYHNTHFWIDQEKNLFGLFMTRAREYSGNMKKEFRRAVYSSIGSER
jgi:CubicO group peptidase (beta-lactamase class C family)|tara:strand:+ start:437 stop:1663 length:1227 start_codon:yes stop_codon:yes gene_type:complete